MLVSCNVKTLEGQTGRRTDGRMDMQVNGWIVMRITASYLNETPIEVVLDTR